MLLTSTPVSLVCDEGSGTEQLWMWSPTLYPRFPQEGLKHTQHTDQSCCTWPSAVIRKQEDRYQIYMQTNDQTLCLLPEHSCVYWWWLESITEYKYLSLHSCTDSRNELAPYPHTSPGPCWIHTTKIRNICYLYNFSLTCPPWIINKVAVKLLSRATASALHWAACWTWRSSLHLSCRRAAKW